jgi:2-keto-4-pentenoate hydratase/2-oxohepta-3-ene-1,7-dioic acid hydratase in catechol pathway
LARPAINRWAKRARTGGEAKETVMAINLVHFEESGRSRWGVVSGARIAPLAGDYPTTASLIELGEEDWRAARQRDPTINIHAVKILSPVTQPCRIYCQGANYRRHMIESGLDPDEKSFNMFFTKADASIASAREDVARPAHVKLLDYEIELALIFRKSIHSALEITPDMLADYVFAIAIANDLSARDVQLPQTQFFKGKSYRGFCPIGPFLTVLDRSEFSQIDALELELAVNGALRQRDNTTNLVFKPAETISELSNFADINAGDVLLTGTPSGCALRVPPAPLRRLLQLLPERRLWKLFIKAQLRRPQYLKPGDRITARIWSRDHAIDMGEQITQIIAGSPAAL